MAKNTLATAPAERLRKALEALPGIRRVLIDESPARVLLVCDPPGGYPPIDAAARALLLREGVQPDMADLQISYLGPPQARRRVRFLNLQVERPRAGHLQAKATLEWNERVYEGRAEGESGPAGDLRVCSQATLHALEEVLEGVMSFQLVGIKSSRIFDDDMVAVLVYATDMPDRRLVGTSMVAEGEPCRAASLAVLNATNRTLGNYLSTTD